MVAAAAALGELADLRTAELEDVASQPTPGVGGGELHALWGQVRDRCADGVPIVWSLYSTDQFNDIADKRTAARREADPKEWAKEMKRVAKQV